MFGASIVSESQSQGLGVSVELSADATGARARADASAGKQLFMAVGNAASWLFPGWDARVKITAALRDRVVAKIASNAALDQDEQYFLSSMLHEQTKRLENQAATIQRVDDVLPEVELHPTALPPIKQGTTSPTFIERAQGIAGEISDASLRDVFARLIAGEISRPGSISLRTLDIVRWLDPSIARAFDHVRRFAFSNGMLIDHGPGKDLLYAGLSNWDRMGLEDAGLVDRSWGENLQLWDEGVQTFTYCDRSIRITILPIYGRAHRNQTAPISGVRLTRYGLELANVLPPAFDEPYFEAVGRWFSKLAHTIGEVEWSIGTDGHWTQFTYHNVVSSASKVDSEPILVLAQRAIKNIVKSEFPLGGRSNVTDAAKLEELVFRKTMNRLPAASVNDDTEFQVQRLIVDAIREQLEKP